MYLQIYTNHFYRKKVANYCMLFPNHKKEIVSKAIRHENQTVSPVPQSLLRYVENFGKKCQCSYLKLKMSKKKKSLKKIMSITV